VGKGGHSKYKASNLDGMTDADETGIYTSRAL